MDWSRAVADVEARPILSPLVFPQGGPTAPGGEAPQAVPCTAKQAAGVPACRTVARRVPRRGQINRARNRAV